MDRVARWMRRNAVVLFGAVATVVASLMVASVPGVYWARAELVLLPPSDQVSRPETLGELSASGLTSSYSYTLTRAAGVVESHLQSSGTARSKYGSPDVTLPDTGVLRGRSIVVPDSGDQWNWSFARQVLDVQVVDRDRTVVEQRMDGTLREIDDFLEVIQDKLDVPPEGRVRAVSIFGSRQIVYRDGESVRAILMTIVLGAFLTVAAHRMSTRSLARRRGASPAANLSAATGGNKSGA